MQVAGLCGVVLYDATDIDGSGVPSTPDTQVSTHPTRTADDHCVA